MRSATPARQYSDLDDDALVIACQNEVKAAFEARYKRYQRYNRLITNMFYDELRKRPKESVISIDEPLRDADGEDGGWQQIADDRAQPHECCEHKEIVAHVKAALERLPKQSRKVIVLREFYGLLKK